MDASKSLSRENNNSSLSSTVPDSSNMYQNRDSNLISEKIAVILDNVCHQIEAHGIFTAIARFMFNNEKFLAIELITNLFA